MRRWVTASIVAGLLSAGALVAMAPAAGAADASGCSGQGTSTEDGFTLDRAAAPGAGGTKDDPFDVSANGEVEYSYKVNRPVGGGTWRATIDPGFFAPNIHFGGEISQGSAQSGSGVEPLKKHLKIGGFSALVGLLKVDIEARGSAGGTCVISGWIKIHGSLLTNATFYLALLLMFLAFLLFYLSMGSLP